MSYPPFGSPPSPPPGPSFSQVSVVEALRNAVGYSSLLAQQPTIAPEHLDQVIARVHQVQCLFDMSVVSERQRQSLAAAINMLHTTAHVLAAKHHPDHLWTVKQEVVSAASSAQPSQQSKCSQKTPLNSQVEHCDENTMDVSDPPVPVTYADTPPASVPLANMNVEKEKEKQKIVDASESTDSASNDKSDELDSFAESRRKAIEATLVSDLQKLPSLDDIIGLQEAKDALFEALVDPVRYPEYFASSNLQPWRCVLLYGPPGTGKSALSMAIAREMDARFYQVSSSDVISSWSGQSERLIRTLFDHALSHDDDKISVLFIDEMDSLCRMRSGSEDDGNRRVKTELLVQLQRLLAPAASRVLLLAATNTPWEIDPAFLRRFEKKIYVSLPDATARETLLVKLLDKTPLSTEVTYSWLANRTSGFSPHDLHTLSREMAFLQFRLYKEQCGRSSSASRTPLTMTHCESVLDRVKASVPQDHVEKYEEYRKAFEARMSHCE